MKNIDILFSCAADSDETIVRSAQKWANFLKTPLSKDSTATGGSCSHHLIYSAAGFILNDSEGRKLKIDFDENHLDYKRRHQGKSELMSKALGASKGVKTVLDLTVGMGIDSVFLTQLGFQVVGVERSPLLFALLSEAFARTQQEVLRSYQLNFADSFDFLRQQKGRMQFDAIYFDPMYPHKKKSALPKQEMVVFRELVGDDEDAQRVLSEALTWDCQRVVVKRPRQSEPLLPGVSHAYDGKIVRYDTYIRHTHQMKATTKVGELK